MNWARKHGVDVRKEDAVAFAQEYASRMPHKMRDFKTHDIEQARAEFEATYQPPQQAEHALPRFVHKIMVSIMNWATQHGVSVNKKDAIAFAQEYASKMPHKMINFKPSDVEQARAEFEATYQPPQQAQHALPRFVHKIMISIMDWATQHGVSVNKKDAIAFAQEYASKMPHKMINFKPSDVEQARADFEATYQPPQQAQQHRGHQHSHNPSSLFGQLREGGRRLGISEDLLNNYLNWYIEQPGISEIAEEPSREDVRVGYDRMVREISHGALMFREVCTNGLSSATIGPKKFFELMNQNPPNDYVWAFHKCPKLQEVQKRMCFKKCGDLENIGCFIAGMVFNPDGSIGFFKQSMRRNTADPTHQLGLPVVLWITRVGHNVSREGKGMNKKNNNQKPKENQNMDNETREREREKERKQKNRDSRRFSNMNMTLAPSLAKNKKNNGVPRVVGDLTPFHMGEMEYILGNPDYHKACQEAMHRMDGMPVDVIKQGTEASEASFLQNQLNNNPNNSLNSAQQNPWGAAGE
jgi:hypothetical protein